MATCGVMQMNPNKFLFNSFSQEDHKENVECSSSSSSSVFIDMNDLMSIITSVIILDCRLLKDYELGHIENSKHINCRDKITKKRLQTCKLTIKDIVNCDETKKLFENLLKNECHFQIIIYDSSSSNLDDLKSECNPLQIVIDNLNYLLKDKKSKILKGGYNAFHSRFPRKCVESEAKFNMLNLCPFRKNYLCEEDTKYSIENAKITKIDSNLYLGNESDSKNEEILNREGITYILNVTKNIPCYHETNPKYKYLRIAVDDACNQNLKQFFEESIKFINKACENNAKVLVHCQAGISRSPTIVIAYLMKKLNLKMNDVYNQIRAKRSIIGPNLMFMSQLADYEDQIFNKQNRALKDCNK